MFLFALLVNLPLVTILVLVMSFGTILGKYQEKVLWQYDYNIIMIMCLIMFPV